jgi:hypothetical protein
MIVSPTSSKVGALDKRDHPVEKTLPRIDRHLHANFVGDHARSRGDRRPVAARLADHRRAFAGDRGLVHRRDAADDVAVRRDQIARLDQHDIADAQGAGGNAVIRLSVALHPLGGQLGLGGAQRCRLRLTATFGERLGKGTEEHRQPQPDHELQLEASRQAILPDKEQDREQQRDDRGGEHHRIADQLPRIEFAKGVTDRRGDQLGGEQGLGLRPSHLR